MGHHLAGLASVHGDRQSVSGLEGGDMIIFALGFTLGIAVAVVAGFLFVIAACNMSPNGGDW